MRKFTLNPIVLAMAVSVVPAATYAQELEEVVVTGSYAQSLKNALNDVTNWGRWWGKRHWWTIGWGSV